jgi:hypothetical protein
MAEFDEVELPSETFAEPDLDEGVRFGAQCRALINSEGYQTVTAQMRATTLEVFSNSPIRDTEGHSYCRVFLQVLEDMHTLIQDAVDTGTMSAQQLEDNARALKGSAQEND